MDQTGGSSPPGSPTAGGADVSMFKASKKKPVALKRILFDNGPDGATTEDIEAAYREIDYDGGGSIELGELADALKMAGLEASPAALENVFKEIDKNLDGTVSLDEFLMFFRHMDELNEFEQKRAQRAQFMSCLLNCCFLGDIVAVGVLLLLFIRMDPEENPDSYIIARNVMMGAAILLGVLFLSVILIPVMRLVFGPQVQYWQARVEEKARQARSAPKNNNKDDGPGRRGAGDAPVPPPSMNKNKSYRMSKFIKPQPTESEAGHVQVETRRGSKASRRSSRTSASGMSGADQGALMNDPNDPDKAYSRDAFQEAAWVQEEERLKGHTSFCPMQIPRLQQLNEDDYLSTAGPLPGAVTGPMAIADSAHYNA